MPAHTVRFKQVDVLTSVPFKGNPLAVRCDADAPDTRHMQPVTHWNSKLTTALRRDDRQWHVPAALNRATLAYTTARTRLAPVRIRAMPLPATLNRKPPHRLHD
ncbi:PhzF family phenazine biosynthesis protein [Paraburkholderia fungorum]